ncbi:MAG: hypothetical protein U5L95_00415 [Candidatus Saccharibacteria bacterium]|nr:hypothetical protein [Candidatus Saccharibacteria bacterium]
MPFFEESGLCTIQEYIKGQEARLIEHDIQPDMLCMAAISLAGNQRTAAKHAARVSSVINKSGIYEVRFCLVNDEDLTPATKQLSENMSGGFIAQITNLRIKDGNNGEYYQASETYFKDYFDEQFGGLLAKQKELSLT